MAKTQQRDALSEAETRLAELEDEQRTLAERTTAARRSGDVEQWMALINRADDLPGEIHAATLALLCCQLDAAKRDMEQLEATKAKLAEAKDAAWKAHDRVASPTGEAARAVQSDVDRIEYGAELSRLGLERHQAHNAWCRAGEDVSAAAVHIRELEARITALTNGNGGDDEPAPAPSRVNQLVSEEPNLMRPLPPDASTPQPQVVPSFVPELRTSGDFGAQPRSIDRDFKREVSRRIRERGELQY